MGAEPRAEGTEVPQTEIKHLLRRLHEELGRGAPLDAEARTLLDAVATDLRRTANASPGIPETSAPSLEALAVRFEADHPGLSATLREIADLLGKAGM
jgi:uncharacterized protein DUF4404